MKRSKRRGLRVGSYVGRAGRRKAWPLSLWAAFIAFALLAPAARATNPRHPGVAGPREGKLSFTLLGPLRAGERSKVAVKWTGDPGERVTVWYDADGDGQFGDEEVVIPEATLEEAITVLEIEVPRWAHTDRNGQLRIATRQSGTAVVAYASGGSCAFASGFGPRGVDSIVQALATYDDGSGPALYVGGSFTVAGTVVASRIARWNGTSWSALGTPTNGVNNTVYALAVYDDGTGAAVYVAGSFTTAGGAPANRIAKWNGTSWSALGSGLGGSFPSGRALVVHDDGGGPSLFVGGDFSTAGGIAASRIAKWDGTSWSVLGSPTNGVDNTVFALATYDDGGGTALYAGGSFTTAGGVAASRIARWKSGSWSALGTPTNGVNNNVLALAVYDDGGGQALYAGGSFTTAGGGGANRIAKWSGTGWSPLGSPTNGVSNTVNALAVYDDGGGLALYVGGAFGSAGGIAANRIAKWNGASWAAMGAPVNGVNGTVSALAAYNDGGGSALYVGGDFTVASEVVANRIAKWRVPTWSALGLGDGPSSVVYALSVYDDGTGPALYAGGEFTTAGGVAASRIAKWNGVSWSALTSGMNAAVWALAVYDDGGGPTLYAAGDFTTAGGATANRIAKWDGTNWSALGSGMDSTVRALVVYDDGGGPALYAAGGFGSAGGAAANRIARWDGASWSALGSGLTGGFSGVYAMAVYDGGSGPELYAGGDFTTAGGVAASRAARWDGSAWSPAGTGFGDTVYALTVFDDGGGPKLYAGGRFTDFFGEPLIAKWDGTGWSPLNTPFNGLAGTFVRALAVADDGSGPALYVGGFFYSAGSVFASNIAKWDGASWSALGSPTQGVDGFVDALVAYDNGSGPALFAGGSFGTAGGMPSSRIAKWQCTCACSYSLPATQWRMISQPCKSSPSTISDLFGDDLLPADYATRWILYERDEPANKYTALELGSSLSQGSGYWIKSLDAGALDVTGNLSPTLCPASSRYSSCFDIPLYGTGTGVQNLLGYPFNSPVDWANVRFVDGAGLEFTPAAAQAAGMASKIMYKWTGGAYEPFDGETPGMEGSLDEWDGIWVKAYQNTTLRVPTPTAVARGETLVPALAPIAGASEASEALASSAYPSLSVSWALGKRGRRGPPDWLTGWYVRVIVSGGGLTKRGTVLGQLSDASDGLDAHDLPELPPFGSPYLTVVFPHPEWGGPIQQYASDYRAHTRNRAGRWTLEVRSDDPTRQVTLDFEGSEHSLTRATLLDLATGRRIRLHKERSYTFTMTGATRVLSFEIPGY